MQFGVVSGVGSGIGVLDGVHVLMWKGRFRKLFAPTGLNGVLSEFFLTEMYSTRA